MYDFDTVIDRRNTHSLKWDVAEGELPMWVADMDFMCAPEIMQALKKRMDNGVFGYTIIPEEWNKAYANWWKTRHNLEVDPDSLVFCTGVVPALSAIVRKLTTPNENVLVQSPVYNNFYNSIANNGRHILENPLVYDGNSYHMDFEQLEKGLADPQTTLMILCNPANPTGNIWTQEELFRIGELCCKYNVVVVSDEIHCDLTSPDVLYTPFASVSEHCRTNSISCWAPTKAFNLAGLKTAAVMVPDPNLRHKVWRALNTDEIAEPNAFAVTAAIEAFNHGAAWLDELRYYVEENRKTVRDFLAKELPQIHLVPSKATYLLWLDCSKVTDNSAHLADEIRKKTGLFVANGLKYGGNGKYFLRLNIACPRSVLLEGLDRLRKALS